MWSLEWLLFNGQQTCVPVLSVIVTRVNNIVGGVSNAQYTMYKPTAASKTSIL